MLIINTCRSGILILSLATFLDIGSFWCEPGPSPLPQPFSDLNETGADNRKESAKQNSEKAVCPEEYIVYTGACIFRNKTYHLSEEVVDGSNELRKNGDVLTTYYRYQLKKINHIDKVNKVVEDIKQDTDKSLSRS